MILGKSALATVIAILYLTGCSFPHSGPSYGSINGYQNEQADEYPISIIKIDEAVTSIQTMQEEAKSFRKTFGDVKPDVYKVHSGDSIDLYIWESSPALLFGSKGYDAEDLSVTTNRLPTQLVEEDGNISVPFVGKIKVAGKSVREIEKSILGALHDKANNPQVMLQVSNRPSAQMTVIGDVNKSSNIPLTPKGERILDVLALSNGITQSFNKIMLSLSRQGKTTEMPLDVVIANPDENIFVNAKDVLVAMYQPWAFTVLGPGGKNQEVKLEATGLNIIQAIARIGGLNDNVANPDGVFVFRFEDKNIFNAYSENINQEIKQKTDEGNVPVVYQLYMSDPKAFFVAQNFKIKNGDIVYLASSDASELTKFLRMVGLIVNPMMSWGNTINNLSD